MHELRNPSTSAGASLRVRELSLGQVLTLDALAMQCVVSLDALLESADQPSCRDLFAYARERVFETGWESTSAVVMLP